MAESLEKELPGLSSREQAPYDSKEFKTSAILAKFYLQQIMNLFSGLSRTIVADTSLLRDIMPRLLFFRGCASVIGLFFSFFFFYPPFLIPLSC
jgi:hypothetical protein